MYIYIYVYIYIYKYMYTYIYIDRYLDTCMYVCIERGKPHTYTHTHMTHTHTHISCGRTSPHCLHVRSCPYYWSPHSAASSLTHERVTGLSLYTILSLPILYGV